MNRNPPATETKNRQYRELALSARGVFPNAVQLGLFQTIFASEAEFAACWDRWTTQLSPSLTVDAVSLQNLPLLHNRVPAARSDLRHSELLSKIVQNRYRLTAARNRLVFELLESSLRTLQQSCVQAIVLKGAALIGHYYKDMGERSMGDFDLLVPQAQFLNAAKALQTIGWIPIYDVADFDPRFAHAHTFKNAQGHFLDLHVHVLHLSPRPESDELFWANSIPIALSSLETRSLCAADLILQLAEHAMDWKPNLQLRWIPDIAYVIARGNPDWDRLMWMARRLHNSIAVTLVLEYMNEHRLASVPEAILAALHAIPVDRWQRSWLELWTRETLGGFLIHARKHWHIVNQQRYDRSLHRRLLLLPAYFNHCAKNAGYRNWFAYLCDSRRYERHLLAKVGLYKRPIIDSRLGVGFESRRK